MTDHFPKTAANRAFEALERAADHRISEWTCNVYMDDDQDARWRVFESAWPDIQAAAAPTPFSAASPAEVLDPEDLRIEAFKDGLRSLHDVPRAIRLVHKPSGISVERSADGPHANHEHALAMLARLVAVWRSQGGVL